jgi:hypothetical protein
MTIDWMASTGREGSSIEQKLENGTVVPDIGACKLMTRRPDTLNLGDCH